MNDATQAFEQLRREQSLVRAAIEGLTAERERIPDYTPQFVALDASQKAMLKRLAEIEAKPALAITPQSLVQEYHEASQQARSADARLIATAHGHLNHAIGQIDLLIKRGQGMKHVQRMYLWCIGGDMVGGIIFTQVMAMLLRAMSR